MDSQKKRLLEKAYHLFFETGTKSVITRPVQEFVDGQVIGIGTAVDEKLRGIGDFRKLLQIQKKQMAGLKIHWEKKRFSSHVTADENTAVYADDVYLTIGTGKEKLKMYLRFSVILHYNGKGWKVIHWHGSKPEEVKSEEDTYGLDQWKKKASELQQLVEQRTADLLLKNRELEIEASLEKVRTVAMGMKERADMLKICTMIAKQLSVLGLKEIRNVQTAIFKVPMGTYVNYEFYAKHDKTFITETLYTNHKVALAFAKKMLKGNGAVAIAHMKGKQQVMDWLRYQKGTNVFIDTYLKTATSLSYYWYSLGPVALGISAYQPLTKEELQLFERFLKVFELAYKRYMDIEKAEAQVREAQIEAALERVRARSMAMQDSSEIGKLILHVYTELTRLDARLDRCFFMIVDPENLGITWWMASQEGLLAENGFFVQYNEHPSHLLYLDHWKKKTKKWHYLFAGKEKRDWDRFGFSKTELSRLPEPVKKFMASAKSVNLSGSSDAFGSLVTGSFEPLSDEHQDIISRFASVFNQTYTRFNDLKKAEAQARESQIEASLERIRSRTVGMQKSEELKEVIQVVYEQFIRLGIHTEHAGFIIDYRERNDYNTWIADQFGSPSQIAIPYFDCIYYNQFNAAKAERKEFFTLSLTRKEKDHFYKGLFKLIPGFPEASKQIIFRHPGFTISTVLLENVALYVENFTGLPYAEEDNAILIRFGKVFQQTYTRFLDLQKAEEQAHEAEVQLALERVRARSLAMHQTSELMEVVNEVAQQLMKMKIDIDGGIFIVINEEVESDRLPIWGAAGAANYVEKVIVPELGTAIFTRLVNAILKRESFLTERYTREEKDEFLHNLFKHAPWKQLPAKRKKELLAREGGYCRSTVISKFTSIAMINHHGKKFSAADNLILQRFGMVLEQSYTRFLDLQKAEEQSKESLIQLALERVRARTMAMQQSTELPEAANLLFLQLQALGMPAWSAGYCIWEDDKKAVTLWMSSEGVIQPPFKAPTTEDELFIQMREGHEKGKALHVVELGGKKLQAHYQYMRTLPVVGEVLDSIIEAGHPLPVYQVMHYAYFSKGYLLFITYEPVPAAHEIFKRFANVFDQTYTRFLDLQKAEAQAKEAFIESALERVRSRSLAMHHSSELSAVVNTLLREFTNLEFTLTFCIINLINEKDRSNTVWAANPEAGNQPESYYMKFEDYPFHHAMWDAWKDQQKKFIYTIEGEEKRIYDEYLYTSTEFRRFPKHVQDANKALKRYVAGFTFFRFSGLQTVSENPISPDDLDILERFGRVFEQSYTRFLDLQKAEAQAREAQIEAALERVRSRSMAMHRSEELSDLSLELVKQVQALGVATWFCAFNIYDDDPNSSLEWGSNGQGVFPQYRTPREGIFLRYYQAGQKGETLLVNEIGEAECPAHYDYLCSLPGVGDQLLQMKAAGLPFPASQIDHVAFFKHGYIIFITYEPVPETHEIFKRFARVFEQSYTRFLDLQKAEAQAREAQIEVAVERVRAKALAMHRSEEILQVAMTLKEQMEGLELKGVTAATIYLQQDDGLIRAWDITELKASENGPQLTVDFAFKLEDTDPQLWVRRIWEVTERYSVIEMSGNDFLICESWLRSFDVDAADNYLEFIEAADLKHSWHPTVPLEKGKLNIDFILPPPAEMEFILPKMGAAFDLAYRRFLDLQKAESQAREAQIETALERVRSRAMAMHFSDELKEVALELRKQMGLLGQKDLEVCAIHLYGLDENSFESWSAMRAPGSAGEIVQGQARFPKNGIRIIDELMEKQSAGVRDYILVNEREKMVEWFAVMKQYVPEMYDSIISLIGDTPHYEMKAYWSVADFAGGALVMVTYSEPDEQTRNLLRRTANVFELAYTRFVDLKKAEAQTREAQIEAALERVRSRSMAMHKSTELLEAGEILFAEINRLGIESLTAGYVLMDKEGVNGFNYTPDPSTKKVLPLPVIIPHNETVHMQQVVDNWKKGNQFYFVEMDEAETIKHQTFIAERSTNFTLNAEQLIAISPSRLFLHNFYFKEGYILIVGGIKLSAEQIEIMLRFAKVFQQTYTRFQDLQKAEAQTKEAQIEAALEKVRSRTMAMQNSNELQETAAVLFQEFRKLGAEDMYQVTIGIYDEASQLIDFRVTSWSGSGEQESRAFQLDMNEPTVLQPAVQAWKNQQKSVVIDLSGAKLEGWLEYRNKMSGVTVSSADTGGRRVISAAFYSKGHLSISTKEPVSAETLHTLERFAAVFDVTYTRFQDLQKAEGQAKEARIEAALERVRSRTLAMQKSDELADTAAVLFQQLIALGIEPNRLYIILIKENNAEMEAWVTDEDGSKVSMGFTGNYNRNRSLLKMYEGWKEKRTSLVIDMQGEELQQYFHYLHDELHVPFKGGLEQKRRVQHIVYFSHGLIGMASPEEQPIETLQLMERFAAVFNLTFTRFNDLKIAEAHAAQAEQDLIAIKEAKQKAEEALTELQATQKQLIQSEKMASLGELTAGIAHEIQNPLNFVNNFSEVSKELLDEIREELDKGNLEDAKEIMQDVIQNLEKIHHHGKRADGIVKGMLQHSRTGSGQMEPTDINALCDEYLRLSYHGLRAKDKSFNARFETHFDQSVGKINVLPQDLGRVILNLINNAFYAVSAKASAKADSAYEPTVEVSTTLSPLPGRGAGGEVSIIVKDNGTGIPQKVLDKIFQPFFTTKPTGQGTGLGLSLSYDIVKAHGGELRVETKEGEGTSFIILIPDIKQGL